MSGVVMRKYISLALVLAAVSLYVMVSNQRHTSSDIGTAKIMTVTSLGQIRTVNEGLNKLAGKNGSIQWSRSEVTNSARHHVIEVEALVTGKDINGLIHKAQYNFYINHDTGRKSLDYCSMDGKEITLEESSRQIVTGSFS
jgi:hypothetical protein